MGGGGGRSLVLTPKSVADKSHQFILTKQDILQARNIRERVGGTWDGRVTGDAPDTGREGVLGWGVPRD